LYLSGGLDYISDERKIDLVLKSEEVSRIIRGLIKSLNKQQL
jgi:hypothetical protein